MTREKLAERKKVLRPFLNGFDPSLSVTVGAMTDLARKNDILYDMLSISRDRVNVGGTAGNWKKCEALLDFLKQKGYAVKLDRKEVMADERISFSIVTTGGGNE